LNLLGERYDELGRPILTKDEALLGLLCNVRYRWAGIEAHYFGKEANLNGKKIPPEDFIKFKLRYENERPMGMKFCGEDYNHLNNHSGDMPPFIFTGYVNKLLITDERLILIRGPVASKLLLAQGSPGTNVTAYEVERRVEKQRGFFYIEIPFEEIDEILIGDDAIALYRHEADAVFALGHVSTPLPHQQRFLMNILVKHDLKHSFTEGGNNRWNSLYKKFNFGYFEGLDRVYDKKGDPLLSDNEVIESKYTVAPLIWQRVKAFKKWNFQLVPNGEGTLFKTSKRLIFIRNLVDDDFRYTNFPEGTRFFFSFSLPRTKTRSKIRGNKKTAKWGELYDFFVDERKNHLQVLIPTNREKAEDWYTKNVHSPTWASENLNQRRMDGNLEGWYLWPMERSFIREEKVGRPRIHFPHFFGDEKWIEYGVCFIMKH